MKKFCLLFILSVIFIFQAGPALASASFDKSLETTGKASGGYSAPAAKDPALFLTKMFGTFFAPLMAGVITMLILSYGGYTLIMSRGNEQEVEKAKNIIYNTLIAIVVMLSAYAIVTLIFPLWQHVTNVPKNP